jgi:hypothetical protein
MEYYSDRSFGRERPGTHFRPGLGPGRRCLRCGRPDGVLRRPRGRPDERRGAGVRARVDRAASRRGGGFRRTSRRGGLRQCGRVPGRDRAGRRGTRSAGAPARERHGDPVPGRSPGVARLRLRDRVRRHVRHLPRVPARRRVLGVFWPVARPDWPTAPWCSPSRCLPGPARSGARRAPGCSPLRPVPPPCHAPPPRAPSAQRAWPAAARVHSCRTPRRGWPPATRGSGLRAGSCGRTHEPQGREIFDQQVSRRRSLCWEDQRANLKVQLLGVGDVVHLAECLVLACRLRMNAP